MTDITIYKADGTIKSSDAVPETVDVREATTTLGQILAVLSEILDHLKLTT